jgi:hypothetical protein
MLGILDNAKIFTPQPLKPVVDLYPPLDFQTCCSQAIGIVRQKGAHDRQNRELRVEFNPGFAVHKDMPLS